MLVLMTQNRRKPMMSMYLSVIVLTITASLLSSSMLPAFAADTCVIAGINSHCWTEGDYKTAERNGMEGNNEVFNVSFTGVDINQEFIVGTFWMYDWQTGYFVELGWLKGHISAGTRTLPEFYKCDNLSGSTTCSFLGSAGTSGTHTFKIEDTDANRIFRFWIDGVEKLPTKTMPNATAEPRSGVESSHSDIGASGAIVGHFNFLTYYIGTQPLTWEKLDQDIRPTNPSNPYYLGTCADHPTYHYKVKKGSVPTC